MGACLAGPEAPTSREGAWHIHITGFLTARFADMRVTKPELGNEGRAARGAA